jgi:hypothetical protein
MRKFTTSARRLDIEFDLPLLSSDGGLLLLGKADRQLGLTARLSGCLLDRRRRPIHLPAKMLAQRIYGICQGWEDCNDFDRLREDPMFGLALGSAPAPQPTLCRFENSIESSPDRSSEPGSHGDLHRAPPRVCSQADRDRYGRDGRSGPRAAGV